MKTVLLKLSGEILANNNATLARSIMQQIKQLKATHQFNIVIGGGNFFRGAKEGKQLGLQQGSADTVGMLATIMNGIILRDYAEQEGLPFIMLSSYDIPGIVARIDQALITQAKQQGALIIFVGGTGNPFFSTDTAAIIRGLQVEAKEVWKATNVDGVYDEDPAHNKAAKLIKQISHAEALSRSLKILDGTALALAQQHSLPIRVFNMNTPEALRKAAGNADFGSTIQ